MARRRDLGRDRRRLLAAGPLALLGLWPAPARTAPTMHRVTIERLSFAPASLRVRRGDRVVWNNLDLFAHTATAAPRFDSGPIAAMGSWSYLAEAAGKFDYVCTLHPTMRATLIVE